MSAARRPHADPEAAPRSDCQSKFDAALDRAGVTRCIVDAPGAYPCRITLEDAEPGEELLLLNYAHQSAQTPFASTGPIFIRRNARRGCYACRVDRA